MYIIDIFAMLPIAALFLPAICIIKDTFKKMILLIIQLLFFAIQIICFIIFITK